LSLIRELRSARRLWVVPTRPRDYYNSSAIFARVEDGEVIEVTRHGRVVAVMIPPPRGQSRYDPEAPPGRTVIYLDARW